MLLEASKNVIDILEPKGAVTTVTTVTTGIQTRHSDISNVLTAAATAARLPHENCHLIF